eukprot:COSAG06_NODE_19873_length_819_cov_0.906944_2_plen_64_part_00
MCVGYLDDYLHVAGRQASTSATLLDISQGCLKPEYPLLDLHYQPSWPAGAALVWAALNSDAIS